MDSKTYSREFKQACVREVIDKSRQMVIVAREQGIAQSTLSRWVQAYRREHGNDYISATPVPGTDLDSGLTVSERARLRELEREVRELRAEKEFLGKAAAFFAKEYR